VSKLFDVCSRSTLQEMEKKEEIKIPWGTGIVGYVAESGEPVNIPDAYKVSASERALHLNGLGGGGVSYASRLSVQSLLLQAVQQSFQECYSVVKLITHLHLGLRLRMCGTWPSCPIHDYMSCCLCILSFYLSLWYILKTTIT
jgi:hypothetical protein